MFESINGSKCPFLVEDYKNHLRVSGRHALSFRAFCQKNHIRERSASQWLRRHGLSVGQLRHEVMSEMLENGTWFSVGHGGKVTRSKNSSPKSNNSKDLRGISITFSDGTIVNIREVTALSLAKFLDSYHQLRDKAYVRAE